MLLLSVVLFLVDILDDSETARIFGYAIILISFIVTGIHWLEKIPS
jgi:hypothetical protein